MPVVPHRPAQRPPVSRITTLIQQRLDGVLDPGDCPAHWRPMHGDFTPWNLRTVGLRQLWLLDWDDAGWGPPDADLAYYEATRAAVRRSRPARASDESVGFWLDRLSRRAMDHQDVVPFEALRSILRSMAD
jgi:aminoglycoside phosphotransferase (APT) family kinase protein